MDDTKMTRDYFAYSQKRCCLISSHLGNLWRRHQHVDPKHTQT